MFNQLEAIFVAIVWIVGAVMLFTILFRVRAPQAGIVIAHRFIPAPEGKPLVMSYGLHGAMPPLVYDADEWALQVIDERGYTNWIHVDQEAFERYPIYSYYPKP